MSVRAGGMTVGDSSDVRESRMGMEGARLINAGFISIGTGLGNLASSVMMVMIFFCMGGAHAMDVRRLDAGLPMRQRMPRLRKEEGQPHRNRQ